MKMVCLHGYMQNGAVLRHKMGSWRKGLKSRIEFDFADAPLTVTETDVPELAERLQAQRDDSSAPNFRSWCAALGSSSKLNTSNLMAPHGPWDRFAVGMAVLERCTLF